MKDREKHVERLLSKSRKSLLTRLKLPKQISQAVSKHPLGVDFAELLQKKPQIAKLDLDQIIDLSQWVEARANDPDGVKINDASLHHVARNVHVGYGVELDTGVERVIVTADGREFMSARIQKGRIAEASIRILGIKPARLSQMSDMQLRTLLRQLHSPVARRAALIWQLKKLPFNDKNLILGARYLSQIATILQNATDPDITWTHAHGPDHECETNGCTIVPDFDFTDCCNEHDICYCHGCTEEDRHDCDVALYDCIKRRGHPILAWIYYQGVVNLGGAHFNYCPEREVDISDESEGNPAAPESCQVTVTLVDVYHSSGDVGNDWSYTVAAGGAKRSFGEHTINPGHTKTWNAVVYSDIRNTCGDTFSIALSINATEHDGGPDDTGGANEQVTIECPGSYHHTVSVSVPEWWETTSTLKFRFRITATCVS